MELLDLFSSFKKNDKNFTKTTSLKSLERKRKEEIYLDKNVFYGLTNVNTGFDNKNIKCFSETDFRIVLERVEQLGLGIYGIEPWKDGEYYGVEVFEDFSSSPTESCWYFGSFNRYINSGDLIEYSATFLIAESLLEE